MSLNSSVSVKAFLCSRPHCGTIWLESFWILLSDFCGLYLPENNYGLLILQNFLRIWKHSLGSCKEAKRMQWLFFNEIIFKQNTKNFADKLACYIPLFIAVSCRCVFPIYATHIWVLILAHGRGLLQRRWATSAPCLQFTLPPFTCWSYGTCLLVSGCAACRWLPASLLRHSQVLLCSPPHGYHLLASCFFFISRVRFSWHLVSHVTEDATV